MSRNKIIKMVHDYTGKSYAACRAFCKYHHWNEYQIKAILFSIDADALENLTRAFDGLSKAVIKAGAKIAATFATLCDNMGAAFRDQSERMQKLAEPFDVNKDYFNNVKMSEARPPLTAHFDGFSCPIELDEPFNYTDTVTAAILNPSEVRENIIKEDLQTEWNTPIKPLSIEEMREQFGLNQIPDVNDPHTPVFAPYYASTGINEKLYGSERGRNTSETGA